MISRARAHEPALPDGGPIVGGSFPVGAAVVGESVLLAAVLGAVAIGVLCGLLPAIRAGRMPVSQALSEQ